MHSEHARWHNLVTGLEGPEPVRDDPQSDVWPFGVSLQCEPTGKGRQRGCWDVTLELVGCRYVDPVVP